MPLYFPPGGGSGGGNYLPLTGGTLTGPLGIGMTPVNDLDITHNQDAPSAISLLNNNATSSASSRVALLNNNGNWLYAEIFSGSHSGNATIQANAARLYTNGGGGLSVGTDGFSPLMFWVNRGEVGRFDPQSHAFLVGLQSANANWPGILEAQFAGNGLILLDTVATASLDNAIVFARNGSAVGSVTTTLTTTAYGTSSDKNLKTLDEDTVVDSGALIDAVDPHPFKWNLTGESDYGFFAQELYAEIGDVTHAVSVGSPDSEYGTPEYKVWGIDTSKLVPLLWAELQALRKRVAQLEGTPAPTKRRR